jgi:hypothetical protein
MDASQIRLFLAFFKPYHGCQAGKFTPVKTKCKNEKTIKPQHGFFICDKRSYYA